LSRNGNKNCKTQVFAGSSFKGAQKQVGPVKHVTIHPKWDVYTDIPLDNDFAMIKLQSPITIDYTMRPICLPMGMEKIQFAGKELVVTGWGVTNSNESEIIIPDNLKETTLIGVERKECDMTYVNITKVHITKNMICAFGNNITDSCQGDSGGIYFCLRLSALSPSLPAMH
jgi:hypothetical protein